MKAQSVAAAPADRFRGYRWPLSVAAVLGILLYSDYMSYGLPAPSEAVPAPAVEPAATQSEPAMFQARLPPELEAQPGGTAPAAGDGANEVEFRDAPAVIEPETAGSDRTTAAVDATARLDVPPL